MAIIKNRLVRKFSTIPNEIILDKRISHVAFRVYAYLVSKPEGWQVYNNEVCSSLDIHQETLAKAWKLLISCGWLERTQQRDNNNQFVGGYEYILYETALSKTRDTENPVHEKTPEHNNKEELINIKKEVINPPTPKNGGEEVTIFADLTGNNHDIKRKLGKSAFMGWVAIAKELGIKFTENEWNEIYGYCIAKPSLQPHEITVRLYSLEDWASKGLNIIESLRKSQSYKALVTPTADWITDAKTGKRLYGQVVIDKRLNIIARENLNTDDPLGFNSN